MSANPNIPQADNFLSLPPRVLLVAPPSAGKTTALKTLVRNGITPCIIATEYPDVLEDTKPGEVLWHYIPPTNMDWDTMRDNMTKINTLSNDALQKLPGVNREKHRQFFDVLNALNNFKDDRTGQVLGDVTKFGPDKAVVIDSLSGLTIMARGLAVGAKPILSQPDYLVIMTNLEQFLNLCAFQIPCMFIMTAHVEKEYNEVDGTNDKMVSTIGRKLAPRIPRFFSDVIHLYRKDTKWFWDTTGTQVESKFRNLPIKADLEPNFDLLVKNWKTRAKIGEK